MFYCDPCRLKLGWSESLMKSRGRCEMCEKTALCHDTPSRLLPAPPPRPNLLARSLGMPDGWRAEQFASYLRLYGPDGVKVTIPYPHEQQTVIWWQEECAKVVADPVGYQKALDAAERAGR